MFMLDTNVLVAIAEGNRKVLSRITELSNDEIAISSLVEMEFRTHVASLPPDHPGYLLRTAVLDTLKVYPFDSAAAGRAAELRRALLDKGKRANRIDTLIAAHAVSLGKVLVTHNAKDFRGVPELRTEDWMN